MPDVPAEIGAPFDSVVAALEAVHGQIYPKREPTFVSMANKLYTGYRFPYFKGSKSGSHKIPIQEVLHYNASALLKTLDSEKWKSEFWDWLQEVSKTPLMLEILKPSDLPYTVVPRNSKPFIPRTQQIDQAASSIKVEQPQNNDNDDSTEFETPSRATRGVKTPARKGKSTLRPVASTYKRDFEDIESDSEEESPIAKRAHYDDYPNGIQPEHEALSSDEDDKIKLVIRADKIPSTAPQGRDGTWICDEEDCNYVVRGGDAESCQERIEAHFKDHQQHGERMQLALTESTRGHLPIKYAYFPPFLILVEMHAGEPTVEARGCTPTPSPSPSPDLHSPNIPSAPWDTFSIPSSPLLETENPTVAQSCDFRALVSQFRRTPRRVSDTISNLTTSFQPPPPEDSRPRRES